MLINSLHGIFSGYSFRSKIIHRTDGDLSVIQMKDLERDYRAIGSDLTKIDGSFLNNRYLLKEGDVLFLAKGVHNHAVVYQGGKDKVVAASAFFVLRPKKRIIDPYYLAWYLNQEKAQRFLKENKAGTYTLNVNRAAVENIPLEIPSLSLQKSIVQIAKLQEEEKQLLKAIEQKRSRLVSHQLVSAIKPLPL